MNLNAAPHKLDPNALDATGCPLSSFYGLQGFGRENSFGYLMRRIVNVVAQEVELEFGDDQLTNAQWMPLLKLYQGVASTVAEVARECEMDAGATTRLLDRLEAKGLCQRTRSTVDRRVVNIELTDAGRAVAQGIPAVLRKVQDHHLEGFSLDEKTALIAMLKRILNQAITIQQARKSG